MVKTMGLTKEQRLLPAAFKACTVLYAGENHSDSPFFSISKVHKSESKKCRSKNNLQDGEFISCELTNGCEPFLLPINSLISTGK
jgi:hypothetical protein